MFSRLTVLALSLTLALSPMSTTVSFAAPLPDLNLPSLGTVAGADLSIMDERDLGEQLMTRVRADASYLSDPETIDYLNRLGYRLVAASNTLPYDFFFFPIRDKSLNAFALPGGFIAVHSGLVVAAKNESELAGVIGHEIGHVTQRHIARMLEQGKSSWAMTLGSILLALLAARAGGNSGADAAMAITMGTQAAMIQNQLAYSRDAEREADRVGLSSLANAGFDPKGMEEFFARLQQNNRYYESASTSYISTHPLTSDRINDVQSRTRSLPAQTHADSLDFLLIQARLRVLQETRYDGWLAVSRYFEDAVKSLQGRRAAVAHYGLSVAYARMNRPAQARDHARSASALAGVHSVILDKNSAEAEFSLAKTPEQKAAALGLAQQASSRYPNSAMVATNYADLLFRAGEQDRVITFLRQQRALTRDNPDLYMLSARSYEAQGKKSLAYAATGDMYALLGNSEAAVYQFELAQRANDGDFYTMSEIDAKLRTQRQKVLDAKKLKD